MSQLIIGVDCATKPSRTGLARAEHAQGRCKVTDLMVCDGDQHPVEIVVDWLMGKAVGPKNLDIARREGWIWFREPGHV